MLPPVEVMLSDLIKLRSENPPGREIEVARYLQGLFHRFGVSSQVIEPEPGRANFIAQLGQGERCLLFLSHTDVVPAGEGWDFAPFSGEIGDGLVRGRGALDCKGLVAAEAYAFLYLAQNADLKGRLILAATADEETGANWGVRYLLEHCPEKLQADFAINEGGEEPLRIGGRLVYFIQVGEKGIAWSRLGTKGVSCHGSLPSLGDNAVTKMASAVAKLGEYSPPVVLTPEVRGLIQALAELKGLGRRVAENNVDSIIDGFEDEAFAAYLRSVTRMTVSPNVIKGGVKANIVPDSCEAEVDVRYLPGQDEGYVLAELTRVVGQGVDIKLTSHSPPTFSPSQGQPYGLLSETLREVVGDVLCLPSISAGGTDSRFLRGAGVPCYGLAVARADYDRELKKTVHGKNERVDIESLRLTAQFLVRLAQKYLGG
ncbi:MAG TPA: M20/M25/M40 family metallo-hydrolase [Dehalococcoidia bacterium]|nr:M20/M25/M40 family metallo-hydrolase [Dehalococcoidia bacterium]